MWMVYSRVVRARSLEYGGCEFESRRLQPETELREDRELSFGQIASNLVISDCASDPRYKR